MPTQPRHGTVYQSPFRGISDPIARRARAHDACDGTFGTRLFWNALGAPSPANGRGAGPRGFELEGDPAPTRMADARRIQLTTPSPQSRSPPEERGARAPFPRFARRLHGRRETVSQNGGTLHGARDTRPRLGRGARDRRPRRPHRHLRPAALAHPSPDLRDASTAAARPSPKTGDPCTAPATPSPDLGEGLATAARAVRTATSAPRRSRTLPPTCATPPRPPRDRLPKRGPLTAPATPSPTCASAPRPPPAPPRPPAPLHGGRAPRS